MNLPDQCLAGLRIFFRFEVTGKPPVQQRIIQSHTQTGFPGGIHIFANQIAAGAVLHAGEIRILAVKQTVSLMMPGRQHYILCSGTPGGGCPFFGTAWFRKKTIRQFSIFLRRDAFRIHGPFAPPKLRIQSKVNINPETGFMEPFHAFFIRHVIPPSVANYTDNLPHKTESANSTRKICAPRVTQVKPFR